MKREESSLKQPQSLEPQLNSEAIDQWEEILKSVTHEQDKREISFDPMILERIFEKYQENYFPDENFVDDDNQGDDPIANRDEYPDLGKFHQVELVRRIAQKKLKGNTRYCILLLLMTGANTQRLSEMLGVSPDTVRRVIARGIRLIRSCLAEHFGEFPVANGKRPPVRVSIFPLDTPDERATFQSFLNEHTVMHVSFRGDDVFKEVMVVYLTGKAAKPR